MRDHYAQAAKQADISVDELLKLAELSPQDDADQAIPPGGEALWRWFLELNGARSNNGFGQNPLSWHDIDAWTRLTGTLPTPHEALTLRSMDNAFLSALAELEKKQPRKA